MKFKVSSASLANVMQTVMGSVPSKPAIAIHGGVLVSADDGEVTFRATDMFTSVKATVEAEVEESGETVVSAKMMQDISKKLPDADVEISDGNGVATVKCLKSNWKLLTLDPQDFPTWEEFEPIQSVTVPRRLLSDMVDRTYKVASKDDSKPILKAIHITVNDGTITMEATDSYRMVIASSEVDDGELLANIPGAALKNILSAKSTAETITIGCSATQACIEDGRFAYVTRIINGRYPNFSALMPQEHATTVSVDASELAGALKRAGVVATVNPAVAMTIEDGLMTIRAASPNQGESTETLPICMEGDAATVGLNHNYVLDCVDCLDGEVVIELNGRLDPAVFKNNDDIDITYTLLPVRV